jgi:hypothetical protein
LSSSFMGVGIKSSNIKVSVNMLRTYPMERWFS